MNLIISYRLQVVNIIVKAIYKVFLCLHGGISPSWHRVSWQNKSTHQGMQCVFSSLFRPITKLMWIPACNETNLQADTRWKGKGIREFQWLWNGPWCGFIEFLIVQRFSVNSVWIIGVCYRGILVSVGQSHDISLWSILSLGNRSINVEMIYKLRVFDINWCLITLIIYVQTLKRLLGELTRGYDTSV